MSSALVEPTSKTARKGVFVAVGLFVSCVWITLSLRIWVRVSIIKKVGWDDATLVFAAVTFTGYCVVVIMIETVGGAQHAQDLSFPEVSQLVGLTVASFDLYLAAMVLFKISICLFYQRFIIRTWERVVIHITLVLSTGYGIFLFFIALLNCGNPAEYLENELKGICLSNSTIYGIQLAGALLNACGDWVLAILPVFILAKATMPMRAKVGAGAVLLLGCCGSVISLVRIQYIKGLVPGPNFFQTAIDLCIWSTIECGLGISAAAAATLRPLFRSLREHTNGLVSFRSRSKSAQDSATATRLTDTMFGDWGHAPSQQEHELRETGGQSFFSIAPVLRNSRVMSKMGISHEQVTEQAVRTPSPAASPDGLIRPGSKMLKSRLSLMGINTNQQLQRPEMVRQPSVREKGISRPIPHIITQRAPPTPTTGMHEQDLIRIDHRRNGSPNWVPNVKPTSDASRNPYFDSPNPYHHVIPASPGEGRPF